MKQYKQQLIGVIIGIIFTLISIAIRPEYIDYTDRAKVVKWFTKFQNSDTAKIIEKDLLSTQRTVAKSFKLDDTNVEMGYVNSLGQVFLKSTGKGYILILIPQIIKLNGNALEATIMPCQQPVVMIFRLLVTHDFY